MNKIVNIRKITLPNGRDAHTTLDERTRLRKELGFRDLEVLGDLPLDSGLGRRVMALAERMRLS
ncbi:MAG: hypothetical protein VW493_10760 [Gammaproteobacteria bacterium]